MTERKCHECNEARAIASGLCLGCTADAVNSKPMKSEAGNIVQARFANLRRKAGRRLEAERDTILAKTPPL